MDTRRLELSIQPRPDALAVQTNSDGTHRVTLGVRVAPSDKNGPRGYVADNIEVVIVPDMTTRLISVVGTAGRRDRGTAPGTTRGELGDYRRGGLVFGAVAHRACVVGRYSVGSQPPQVRATSVRARAKNCNEVLGGAGGAPSGLPTFPCTRLQCDAVGSTRTVEQHSDGGAALWRLSRKG